MNHQKRHAGFTLIEMMVSVALFATVVTVALPTMIVVTKASARAQALQTTIDNTSFALDSMSRSVRFGTMYHCTNESITVTTWNATTSPSYPYKTPRDCENGASTLVFLDQYGARQAYRYNSASSTLEEWHQSAGAWAPLTAPRVEIKDAKFTVTGTTLFDGQPPVAQFSLRGAARDEQAVPEFTLSTVMTQYNSERGFAFRKLGQGTDYVAISPADEFGTGVASLGDIDSDGVGDIIVGMSSHASNTGGAQVLRMNRNGTIKASTQLYSDFHGIPGLATSTETFGASVTYIDDFDGDNQADVLIGAPGYENGTGAGMGAVYLATILANGEASSVTRIASNANGMSMVPGGSRFGASAARISSQVFLIGAPGNSEVCTNCGALYMMRVNNEKIVTPIAKISSNLGLVTGEEFGSSAAFLGYDTSGNYIVAVGAANAECAGGLACGAVYILSITSTGGAEVLAKLVSDEDGMPTLPLYSRFGRSVVTAGDMDGDGVVDIMVGAEESGNTSLQGSFYILFMNADYTVKEYYHIKSGSGGAPTLTNGDAFGSALANIGDINGDGRQDFAVGARLDDVMFATNSGAVYILFGK